jgi:ABC-type multidrug transport system fused ATPase/permease subunit
VSDRYPQGSVREVFIGSLRGRRRDLFRLGAWSLVEAVPAVLIGRLVAEAIDEGFLAGKTGTGFAWLGLLAVATAIGALGTRQTFRVLARLVEPFRDQMVRVAVTGSIRRSASPGAVADTAGVARVTHQAEIVREAYAGVLLVVQQFLVVTVSALIGLLSLMAEIALLVVPPLVAGLAVFLGALRRMAATQREAILAGEHTSESASALAAGMRDVVACGGEETMRSEVAGHIEAQAEATRRLARLTAVRTLAVAMGGWVPILLIVIAGPWLVSQGATPGIILGALTYVVAGVQPALQTLVNSIGNTGLWLVVTLRWILNTGRLPESAVARLERARESETDGHTLELSNVTFGYGRHADPVIQGLDLVVAEGEHLAIVGPSGVGKSTLASLIAGLLEPQSGEIRLGGARVHNLDVATLAAQRVLIPQEAYVFAGTLHENLTYLNQEATVEQLDDAIDRLGARALADRLGGYDAEVDPHALSAGEKQLLTLVRAYVAPAGLVILDEATCHLDPAAESRVEEAFARRPGTLVVIAHRISSALRASRILVMDGGRALTGSNEELLAASPLYRDLVGRWWPESADAGARVPAGASH